MKATVLKPTVVTITHVAIRVPVNYGEEDIPYDFPLRNIGVWEAIVNIDTGEILGWPTGRPEKMHMKVNDGGSYRLLSLFNGFRWVTEAEIKCDYVPHGVVPGEYGDYIIFDINRDGIITNWPKAPDVSAFFKQV